MIGEKTFALKEGLFSSAQLKFIYLLFIITLLALLPYYIIRKANALK
ncbi:hypothetical protein J2T50_001074 [Streptococcus gallinaceus]|uniref:Uncharacterized protein n=1 Tax=Streptococcus gallinaceus TaxID=165758 RepID=A0ABV2JN68_9STRE|nr:hypothetical protein [Streptococcus gallinaceus]MCP1769979.1 hypothetical protein [Streptococcus gallinaceus]CRH89666.1 Uncharacterised protein [Chlamydia trachomatis]